MDIKRIFERLMLLAILAALVVQLGGTVAVAEVEQRLSRQMAGAALAGAPRSNQEACHRLLRLVR